MTALSLRYLYILKRLINTHPFTLLGYLLMFQVALFLIDKSLLTELMNNPIMLSIVIFYTGLFIGLGLFFVFSIAIVHIIPLGLTESSSKRWEGVANKQGYWIKRRSSFKHLYELSQANKKVKITENVWFKEMFKQGDRSEAFFVLYFYYWLSLPLFAMFSQSTTAEIEIGIKLPHIIFDNPAASIGGVKAFDLLLLQPEEVLLKRSGAKVYVQIGTEIESYQLLDPVFLEVIENALTIFDIEFCGSKVIIRTDHLLNTKYEQEQMLDTINQILNLKPKLLNANYPSSKTKPRMVLDDQALRTRLALKGVLILAFIASIYIAASINF